MQTERIKKEVYDSYLKLYLFLFYTFIYLYFV